jgi:serine phosphatase RsbU (regulator of sigma subunit)
MIKIISTSQNFKKQIETELITKLHDSTLVSDNDPKIIIKDLINTDSAVSVPIKPTESEKNLVHLLYTDNNSYARYYENNCFIFGKKELADGSFINSIKFMIEEIAKNEQLKKECDDAKKNAKHISASLAEIKDSLRNFSITQCEVMQKLPQEGYDCKIFYQPKSLISGDIFLMEDIWNKTYITIIDVADHGVFAGMYGTSLYVLAKSYLHIANTYNLDLTEWVRYIIKTADTFQAESLHQRQLSAATAVFCEIDKTNNKARFINLGDGTVQPIVIPKNQAEMPYLVDFGDNVYPLLGDFVKEMPSSPTAEIPFHKGDGLVFYSDGVTEIFNNTKEKDYAARYSSKRLLSSVIDERNKDGYTASSIYEGIKKDLDAYSYRDFNLEKINDDKINAADDVTLAVIIRKEGINK